MRTALWLAIGLAIACGKDPEDTSPTPPGPQDADTDVDADADADADADTDTDVDTDTAPPKPPTFAFTGEACGLPGDWSGSETLTAMDDGDVICAFTWTVASATSRDDCPDCDYAFDLTWDGGEQTAGDCSRVGLDDGAAHDPEAYGFAPTFTYAADDYTDVLLRHNGTEWRAVGDVTAKGDCISYDGWGL